MMSPKLFLSHALYFLRSGFAKFMTYSIQTSVVDTSNIYKENY
jgi:hypothetical protein